MDWWWWGAAAILPLQSSQIPSFIIRKRRGNLEPANSIMDMQALASSSSSTSGSSANPPPPEDAWFNTYLKLIPQWQSLPTVIDFPAFIFSIFEGSVIEFMCWVEGNLYYSASFFFYCEIALSLLVGCLFWGNWIFNLSST